MCSVQPVQLYVRTCVNLCMNKLWLDKVRAGRYLFVRPVQYCDNIVYRDMIFLFVIAITAIEI